MWIIDQGNSPNNLLKKINEIKNRKKRKRSFMAQ